MGDENRFCNCDKWLKFIDRLNAPEIFIQTTRPEIMKPYPTDGKFEFCPWYGEKLLGKKSKEIDSGKN